MASWARADHLSRVEGPVDLLVIGGGVVGAGTALDAAARGMSVVVVERADWASGTSGRSTKLLHGGIRYLAQFRFGLIREGLREQKVLAQTADYLCRPIDFVIPVYRDRAFADAPRWARHPRVFPMVLRLGLWLYDRLGGRSRGGERQLSSDEVLARFPRLRPDGLRHGLVYRDAQTDDARLTVALARTAVGIGAVAVNHCTVTAVRPDSSGYVAMATDQLSGQELELRARSVVAATGPLPPPAPPHSRPMPVTLSKGAHLVMRPDTVDVGSSALVLPETEDERVLFLVPWLGHVIVGTTDTEWEGSEPAHPRTTEEDIGYLMGHVRDYLEVEPGATPISAWSGLRTLAAGSWGRTSEASRAHRLVELAPGYIQVAGGKLTGYRRIASEITDRIADHLGVDAESRTATLLLTGAGCDERLTRIVAEGLSSLGLSPALAPALVGRYGTEAASVLAIANESEKLATGLGDRWIAAEAAHSVRHESAATITDVASRRTRMDWLSPDHGRAAAATIGEVLATELGWDETRLSLELRRFETELQAEGL